MRAIPDEYRECNAVSNVQNAFSVWGDECCNYLNYSNATKIGFY